jgi:thioredoxin reductase/ferredoxin
MSDELALTLIYLLPMLLLIMGFILIRRKRDRSNRAELEESLEAGLSEPPSLHPVIDNARCVGSGACAAECPEEALGVIGGKAVLINPSACIGHGACHGTCPVDAITLVFGTERRGVDIPLVKPTFETNVEGIYIAGELGGMGLIRKAAEQGRQAMDSIAKARRKPGKDADVLIVGAGPAGIAAGLGAIHHKLRYILIEQESSLGGTVYHFPRNKVAMTHPVELPVVGMMHFTEVTKEKLLEFWWKIVQASRLQIRLGQRMQAVVQQADGTFEVTTASDRFHTGAIVLAIGRRGSPRKLDVPGEDLPKVVYRLMDASQYHGMDVVVVGGGDSAVEAALACSEAGARVLLSYRSEAFSRIKAGNRKRLEAATAAHKLRVLLKSEVTAIRPDSIDIQRDGVPSRQANDAVIVCVGGVLPTELLKSMGIRFDRKFGTR